MNVNCPACATVFRVDPAKVPAGGVRARCSACGGVIAVGLTVPAQSGTPSPVRSRTLSAASPARATPAAPFVPRQTPPTSQPAMQRQTPAMPAPAVQRQTPAVSPTQPISRPTAPTTPRVTPISVPAYTPPAISPVTAAPQPPAAPATGDRRPVNPFLTRDPAMRARRLARALVSDMVAYYPAKHAEGLDKGTLKELFRDEIKKSYEEYTAQVGADFARTTTHFQESLNEVLGAGKKIF